MWFRLAAEHACEAFKPGEIHARRESRPDRDRRDPEQPLADTHLIPGVTPRSERRLQGRPDGNWPLLGKETGSSSLPCAISVPNLITDRGIGFAGFCLDGNVRRLMYQSLIWPLVVRHDARGVRAPFDAKYGEGLADALVHRVRRDLELCRDLL